MGEIHEIRKYLKIRSKSRLFLDDNAESIRSQIYQLLKQTVEFGESNSALLIGPSDTEKAKFLDDIIDELAERKTFSTNVIIVRLHGLLHINDRLALKAITCQLKLDNAVVEGQVFGSFAENLTFLLDCLKNSNRSCSKSVLFILDDFDLFCAHHNQTLLYNLFDISQSEQVPICVFGITSRLDVVELFEKRVKSRFSHRQYFLFHNQNVVDRLNGIKNLLIIPSTNNLSNISKIAIKNWNGHVNSLLENKNFKKLIQQFMDVDLGCEKLKNSFIIMFSLLSDEKMFLTLDDFEKHLIYDPDETIEQIQDLTVLELCLLIAMKHHWEIYDSQPMNFEMIYTRYTKFINSAPNMQNAKRAVAMKAFENIQNMQLISPKSLAGEHKLQKEYHMFNLEVTSQQIMEAISKSAGLPTYISQWANCPVT